MGHCSSAGIIFRTGLPLIAGERVASSLVLTLGVFDCAIHNAACFVGNTFPTDGSIMHFGDVRVYVATIAEGFPSVVTPVLDVPLARDGLLRSAPSACGHPRRRAVLEAPVPAPVSVPCSTSRCPRARRAPTAVVAEAICLHPCWVPV